jgi:glycosyltransferase involved in cell wall biosynthesis
MDPFNRGLGASMRSTRPKVAVAHPRLVRGGSEACALRAVEALKSEYAVTLIAGEPIRLSELNAYYETNIDSEEIEVREIPLPALFRGVDGLFALRGTAFARYCRRNAPAYDVMISAYSVMDFGRKGIQFIADFSFDDGLREKSRGDRIQAIGALCDNPWSRLAYLWATRVISGTTRDGWKRNLTVANSNWSARLLKEKFGVEAQTLYPPVSGQLPCPPWEEREEGFIYLGRISPEKRIEDILWILQCVRDMGNDVHLHIVGDIGDNPYGEKIARLCREHGDWASMEGQMSGKEKGEFIGCHRYGISARDREPFGISIAEMVKAGCLVWVPGDGGQVEIVDCPELTYTGRQDGVSKIDAVLKDGGLAGGLRARLGIKGELFTVERFKSGVRDIVGTFLESEARSASSLRRGQGVR